MRSNKDNVGEEVKMNARVMNMIKTREVRTYQIPAIR